MKKKNTFQRYEQKYILSTEQKDKLSKLIREKLKEDAYPHSQIASLYYDTKDYRLIRASIDAQGYKEKLRLRRYYTGSQASGLFIEIKRKSQGLVYKRRKEIKDLSELSKENQNLDQIDRELGYVFSCHPGLEPAALICYHRDAYISKEDSSLRITLDTDIRARFNKLEEMDDWSGKSVLHPSMAIMEVKSEMGYPRWFLDFLGENQIWKSSFSKYGTAYKNRLAENRGQNG